MQRILDASVEQKHPVLAFAGTEISGASMLSTEVRLKARCHRFSICMQCLEERPVRHCLVADSCM